MLRTIVLPIAALASLALSSAVMAQSSATMPHGKLEHIKVFGPSLEGNLEGDDPNRDVFVYLPPSYASSPNRRYPVLYFLHGYSLTAERMVGFLGLEESANGAIAGGVREMIIVLPDGDSIYSGSMYSNSPTTGDWEGYISKDLVRYVDQHYRTIPERASRGLGGHSMGGYGTVRIGMKAADVFGAMYSMSACCLLNRAPSKEQIEKQIADRGDAPAPGGGFANVLSAQAAAWAPNPQLAPRYFDWPYEDGKELPLVQAKWIANSPLVFVDQYVPELKSYNAIMLDVGDADGLNTTNRQLDEAMTRLGIEHGFELYEGDHVNRVKARFGEKVLPFFSQSLAFE